MLQVFPIARLTTKFNQGMYAQMRAKKNEPLSNLGAKNVRVMDKGASVTPATLATPRIETMRTASPATSVEEIFPNRRGSGLVTRGRTRLTLVCLVFGTMLGLQWLECKRLLLLRR